MNPVRLGLTILLVLTLAFVASVATQPLSGPEYIALTPCRIFDSRNGSPLPGGEITNLTITGTCGVPANAVAADLNFTIVGPVAAGHLTAFPAGGSAPLASLVNYVAGQTVANAADVKLGAGGAVSVQPLTTTNLVIDVYGYFTDVEELAGNNTALGFDALAGNTTGGNNTATGWRALGTNSTGSNNTATGTGALAGNTTGRDNTATGLGALGLNTTGNNNTATGFGALATNSTGSNNIAIGRLAGIDASTGSNNIHIGHEGTDTDAGFIRIGTGGTHTSTFIAGIFGQPVASDGAAVVVDSTGKLGTIVASTPSSRRVKVGTHDMDAATAGLLKLRPVTFRYLPGHGDGGQVLQYGLIAEEVAEIYPELVVLDKDGLPSGIRYHVLPAMLLNELQRQQRRVEAQNQDLEAEKAQTATRLDALQREIDELRAQVRALIGGKAALRE